jgi:beta-galactosidase
MKAGSMKAQGIYRDVWLNRYDQLHIADGGLFVYADVKDKTADITIETTVENQYFSQKNCTVYSYITTRDGKRIAQTKEQPLTLAVNGKGTVKQKSSMSSDPKLWSLEDPYLYRVVSVVKSAGKVVDTIKQRFGVRTIRFDATQGFFLNGKHMKIQGVNNHQDHAGVGSAVPDELQYYRIWL